MLSELIMAPSFQLVYLDQSMFEPSSYLACTSRSRNYFEIAVFSQDTIIHAKFAPIIGIVIGTINRSHADHSKITGAVL